MSEKSSENSENKRVAFMTAAIEAAHMIRLIAEPRCADDSVKTLIARAARKAGVGFERAKAIWYREARVIRAEEMDRLREIAARRQAAEEAASHELDEFRARLDRLEALMGTIDPDFYQPHADALRDASRGRE